MFMGKQRRDDGERFIEVWATDLGALLHETWPNIRYVGPRIIDAQPGLLITGPRGEHARFDAALNFFLYLSEAGLSAFFRDDLVSYARFNAYLRWLDRLCMKSGVDLPGGSQRNPLTQKVSMDSIFDVAAM